MVRPAEYSFIRYLAAKQSVDDRALNRGVRDALGQALAARPAKTPLRVLEIGCGLGAMAARLMEWGYLTDGAYTGIDLEPAFVAEARRRLNLLASRHHLAAASQDGVINLKGENLNLSLTFEALDFFEFAARKAGREAWDLICAHAFLDLLDLDEALAKMLALLRPGGWFYFTLNFDGATIFQPAVEPGVDRQIEALYHRTMMRRSSEGKLSDGSATGRRLFGALKAAGARVLAAGGSDWVVWPEGGSYPGNEAYFLHFIIHTMAVALAGHPELDPEVLDRWIEERHAQIEAGALIYLAHQLDFFGTFP
jgi:SAM-dependent methyltransferase